MAIKDKRSTIQQILDIARVMRYLEENRWYLPVRKEPMQAVIDALQRREDELQAQRDREC